MAPVAARFVKVAVSTVQFTLLEHVHTLMVLAGI